MFMSSQGTGNTNAKVMFVRDYSTFDDIRKQEHFADGAGTYFKSLALKAGIIPTDAFYTSLSRVNLQLDLDNYISDKKNSVSKGLVLNQNSGLYFKPELLADFTRLKDIIAIVRPNVVVPVGEISHALLSGEYSLRTWRGSVSWNKELSVKILPTLDPIKLLRMYQDSYKVERDLQRVFFESKFSAYAPPSFSFQIAPSFDDVMTRLNWLIDRANNA